METEELMVHMLTEICDKKSASFLESHPTNVYRALTKNENMDRRLAGALLLTLLEHIPTLALEEHDVHKVQQAIEAACLITHETCERLARVYGALFGSSNLERWEDLAYAGLEELKDAPLDVTWEGEDVWQPGSANLVCHYTAEIKLMGRYPQDDEIDAALEENPLLTAEEVRKMFTSSLETFLDDSFEYFCGADDYYQPVVEDFEAEHYTRDWCSKHGFELVSFEGEGWDDGFEPRGRRWRW